MEIEPSKRETGKKTKLRELKQGGNNGNDESNEKELNMAINIKWKK